MANNILKVSIPHNMSSDPSIIPDFKDIISDISDTVRFFFTELDLSKDGFIGIMHRNNEKDQSVIELTKHRVSFWGKWNNMKDGYEMDCFGFSVNGKKSKTGIGLDGNDRITIILSDKRDKHFFTIDAPKGWDTKNRTGEKWRLHKVNDEDEITDVIDLESWAKLVEWYHKDDDSDDIIDGEPTDDIIDGEPTDDMDMSVTI